MAELFINLLIVVILAGTATLIKYFNGEGLISGYNTASPEEQKYMSEKGIGKFVGNYLYLMAAVLLCGYLARKAGFVWGVELSWVLFVIIMVTMIIRSRRFNPPGPPSRGARISAFLTVIIVLAVAAGITWTALPSEYIFQSEQLKITGVYGISIKYEDIESIQLEDKIPSITFRTNGLGLGPFAKGHFQMEGGQSVRLFLRSREAPFLCIQMKNKQNPVIINFRDAEQTNILYKQLKSRI